MKIKLLFGLFLVSVISWGQTSLTLDNFGTTAQNPMSRAGWATVAPAGSPWELRTTGASTTYSWTNPAVSFSGGANAFTNLGNGTATKTLTYDNSISTIGYTGIAVRFGGLRSGTVPALDISYSIDGTTYVSAGTVTLGTTWAASTTNLPVGAEGVANLRVRISVVANNNTGNFLRLDDFHIIGTLISSTTITTGAITGSPFCVTTSGGTPVSVPFTSTGTFTGNTYTAQLSNASGSFASPTNIGTLVSNANSGTISAGIPANTPTGTGYRIRVISNGPSTIGTNNGTDLAVNFGTVSIAPTATQTIPVATNGTLLTATESSGAVSRQWYMSTTNGGPYTIAIPSATATTYTPNFALTGTYYVVCETTYACGTSTSTQVQINVILVPDILLSSANPAVPATNVTEGSINNVVYAFSTAITTANATLNSVTFTTTGGYVAGNLTNFKLWYSTDAIFSSVSDTNIKTITTTLGPGAHTFSALTQAIANGTTGYFFITIDLPCPSTATNNLVVSAITTANLSFASGNKSGTAFASGTQTIQDDTPINVTGAGTSSCATNASTVSWTLPTNCYDNILVFATNGSFSATLPTGNGGAYTANTVFSNGTAFDGGFCVYKGTGSTVIITGLTNGINYTYKIFTRNGTTWSSGVEVSCIPVGSPYCVLTATDTGFEHISNVTVGADINNNTASSGYADYTVQIANTTIGSGTPISVTITPSYTTDNVYVYIDWNQDGDWLDAGENITMTYTAVTTSFTATGTITPPVTAITGNTRMRVVLVDGSVTNACNGGANFTYGEVEDYTINVIAACVPTHTVTSFTPTSGPIGTEVTINGTGLTGAIVSFSGVNATIVSNTGIQIVVIVPASATTGILSVKDSQPCSIDNSFTVISNDNSSCEGASSITDLIIYDIHDEKTGSGGFITLYNGTAATIDLTNYSIYRTSTHDDGNEVDYATLTGTIASGALGILKVSVGSCGPASTNGTIDGGFNENDGLQLRNAAGTIVVDDVDTYPTAPGYYMVRNAGMLSARTSYVGSDWSTTPLIAGECYPSAGLTLPSGGTPPIVTTHPTYSPSCGSTSVVLNTAGTEGFAGGNALAYQWYFAAPGSATWTAVTDGGIYSGATTASLNISVVTGVLNYQYYCQIRENSATCYSASNAIKITDSSASTWNGSTWIGGTPTLTKAAIIDGTYVTATNGNFSCCSLTVNGTRTLTISSGGYVEVQNDITNNGTLDVLNNGSLVQINDAGVNTGNIRYNRTANIRKQDYVYWSSPVATFGSNAVSPGTSLGYQYKWLPTTGGINNFGNWTFANETMILAKGYCLRGPDSFSLSALTNYTATFIGVPNNGIVTIPISRGTWNGGNYSTGVSTTPGTNEDDNWNLVGNPYPSSIHAIDFLTLNTNIAGFVNIWTHGTLPSNATADPFYNDYAYNYTPSDYITYNSVGGSSGPGVFNGRIAGGQGFFVSMLHTSAATTENLIFNNSLRSRIYDNSQFYRTSSNNTFGELEKHRIWFDLVSPSGASVRSLLGYVENATNQKDRLFDAFSNEKLSFNIFSLIDEEQMLIQGRILPFDNNDKVNIGVSIPQDGLYKIALSSVDGLFLDVNQKIYLEDKLLSVIYDLKTAPYSFMANKGVIKDRFVIRYTSGTVLANESFDANNDVVVVSNQELSIHSIKEKIASIIVYDVLGRKLYEAKKIEANNFTLPISKQNAPLFIEIGLENGIKINRKTVY